MLERVALRKTEGSLWILDRLEVKKRNQSGWAIFEQTYSGAKKTRKSFTRLLAQFIFNGSGKTLKEPDVLVFLIKFASKYKTPRRIKKR